MADEHKKGLFRIGEVAKLFHLSISSLRHYEDIDLLQPEYIDRATGYRYYGLQQFEMLNTIRYLRALDMKLPAIRDFLHHKDVGHICELLMEQRQTVQKKIAELTRIERKLDNRLGQLQAAQSAEYDVVHIEKKPTQRMVWLQHDLKNPQSHDFEQPIRQMEGRQQEALAFLGKVGISMSVEHMLSGDFSAYDGIFLLLDEEDHYEGKVTQLPAGDYAVLIFRGSHSEAGGRYQRLLSYITAKNLQIAGPSEEITLIDQGFTSNIADFVTEIRIPVQAAETAAARG